MASKAELQSMPAGRHVVAGRQNGSGRLTYVPWAEMAGDIAAWDHLAENAAEPNPFFESWYLLPALRAFDRRGEAMVLRFEHGGQLAGLLPVGSRRRYYGWPFPHLLSWHHDNCFLGTPLVAKGCEVPFWQALFGWADDHAGNALFLHLRNVPLAGPVYAAMQAVLAGSSRQAALVHREERALLASDLDAEAYWDASLSGKKRKELRRQLKRLGEKGEVTFDRRTDLHGLSGWIDTFLALEASGWKGKAGSALSASIDTETLFRNSLQGAATRGKLERLSLLLGGEPIAMLATFLTPPGAFSFKTAFDEDYAPYSPGVLLQHENLAILDRDDIEWCDSCAAADHPMIDRIWRERRAIGRYSIAIGGTLRRAVFGQLVRLETSRNPAGAKA